MLFLAVLCVERRGWLSYGRLRSVLHLQKPLLSLALFFLLCLTLANSELLALVLHEGELLHGSLHCPVDDEVVRNLLDFAQLVLWLCQHLAQRNDRVLLSLLLLLTALERLQLGFRLLLRLWRLLHRGSVFRMLKLQPDGGLTKLHECGCVDGRKIGLDEEELVLVVLLVRTEHRHVPFRLTLVEGEPTSDSR